MDDILSASLAASLAAAGVESGLVSSDAPLSELYERLAELASSSGSVRPCGHIFHRGDLVYSCRDCEVDSTCVLCESCFSASDHAGHNVLFHRTGVETGGCCDCGDDEAWCIAGMCPSHRPRRAGEEAPPPTAAFPPRFLELATAIIDDAVDAFAQATHALAIGFDAARREVVAHRRDPTRSSVTRPMVAPTPRASPSDQFVVLLLACGAVRKVADVTNALCRAGMSAGDAKACARRASEQGHAYVGLKRATPEAAAEVEAGFAGLPFETACGVAHCLRDGSDRALPVAIVPCSFQDTWRRSSEAIQWLDALAQAAPSLGSLVCASLCRTEGAACAAAASAAAKERDDAATLWIERADARRAAAKTLPDVAALRKMRARELKQRLRDLGVDSSACLEKSDLVALLLEQSTCAAGGGSGAGGAAGGSGSESAPAARTSADDELEQGPIAAWSPRDLRLDLLLRWHSRMPNDAAAALLNLLSVLLPDPTFKASLMDCCVRQHPQVMMDRVACIGSRERSILSALTVQLYTVPSLVRSHMPATAAGPGIAQMLLQCLYDALSGARQLEPDRRSGERHLDLQHRTMTYRRYQPAIRDLTYIVAIPDVAAAMRSSPECIELICTILALVNGGGFEKRVPSGKPHVLLPSRLWTVSTQFCMAIQNIFPRLIGTGFEDESKGTAAAATRSASLVNLAVQAAAACVKTTAAFCSELGTEGNGRKPAIESLALEPLGTILGEDAPSHVGFGALDVRVKRGERTRLSCSALHFPLQRLCTAALFAALKMQSDDGSDDGGAAAGGTAIPAAGHSVLGPFVAGLSRELEGTDVALVQAILALIEPPLQALGTAAQVEAGMWVRNGDPVVLAAEFYRQPPSCVAQRDVDTASLQLGVMLLGAEWMTKLVFHRFGVTTLLLNPTDASSIAREALEADADSEQQQRMAAEAISLLVRVAVEVPGRPFASRVRRELVHQLLAAGTCRHSEFETSILTAVSEGACCGGLLNDASTSTNAVAKRILADVARRLPATATRSAVYELWSGGAADDGRVEQRQMALLREYDPSFAHLTREEHQVAAENLQVLRRRYVQSAGESSSAEWSAPVSACPPVGSGPATFVRSLLCSASFVHAISCTLNVARMRSLPQRSDVLVAAVAHALSLAVQQPRALANSLFASAQQQQLPGADDSQSLLTTLVRWKLSTVDSSSELQPLVSWIVAKFRASDPDCEQLVAKEEALLAPSVTKSDADDAQRLEARSASQRSALAAMAAQQALFLTSLDLSSSSEEDDDNDDDDDEEEEEEEKEDEGDEGAPASLGDAASTLPSEPTAAAAALTCILCHEDIRADTAHTSAGFVGLVQTCHEGAHLSSCGHALHRECWESYSLSLIQRHHRRETYEGHHTIDVERAEFLCPLCKTLSNSIFPLSAPQREQTSTGAAVTAVAGRSLRSTFAALAASSEPGTDHREKRQRCDGDDRGVSSDTVESRFRDALMGRSSISSSSESVDARVSADVDHSSSDDFESLDYVMDKIEAAAWRSADAYGKLGLKLAAAVASITNSLRRCVSDKVGPAGSSGGGAAAAAESFAEASIVSIPSPLSGALLSLVQFVQHSLGSVEDSAVGEGINRRALEMAKLAHHFYVELDEKALLIAHTQAEQTEHDAVSSALATFVRAACLLEWSALPLLLKLLHSEVLLCCGVECMGTIDALRTVFKDDMSSESEAASGAAVDSIAQSGRDFLRGALPLLCALASSQSHGEDAARAIWLASSGVGGVLRESGLLDVDAAWNNGVHACMSRIDSTKRHGLVALPLNYADVLKRLSPTEAAREFRCPAMCLICGEVLKAGQSEEFAGAGLVTGPGSCTRHMAKEHAGIGMILLLKRSAVVLMRGRWSAM